MQLHSLSGLLVSQPICPFAFALGFEALLLSAIWSEKIVRGCLALSDMGHIPKQTAFYAGPKVRLLDFCDSVHRPSAQFGDLNKASLSCLAVHDDYDEIVLPTSTSKSGGEAWAGCRCHSCLDSSE